MITLTHGTAAFLKNNGNILLLKRGEHRKIAPGFWSGPGGHFEEHEMDTPFEVIYREIEEETGIIRENIQSIWLAYIIIRRSKDEIRQLYIFFGETSQTDIIQTDEGQLFWIPEAEMMARRYTEVFTAMLEHYMERKPNDRAIYAGVSCNNNGKLKMNWSKCEDFE